MSYVPQSTEKALGPCRTCTQWVEQTRLTTCSTYSWPSFLTLNSCTHHTDSSIIIIITVVIVTSEMFITHANTGMGISRVFVCLFVCMISQKPMQQESPNLTPKCSMTSHGKLLILGQKVKGRAHESQKSACMGLCVPVSAGVGRAFSRVCQHQTWHVYSIAVAQHALTQTSKGQQSRSHGYKNRHGCTVASDVSCYGRCRRGSACRYDCLCFLVVPPAIARLEEDLMRFCVDHFTRQTVGVSRFQLATSAVCINTQLVEQLHGIRQTITNLQRSHCNVIACPVISNIAI